MLSNHQFAMTHADSHFRATAAASELLLFSAVRHSPHLYAFFFDCNSARPFFATFPQMRPSAPLVSQVTYRHFSHRKEFRSSNDVGICFGFSGAMGSLQLFFFLQVVLRQTGHVLQLGAAHCGWQQSMHLKRRPGWVLFFS